MTKTGWLSELLSAHQDCFPRANVGWLNDWKGRSEIAFVVVFSTGQSFSRKTVEPFQWLRIAERTFNRCVKSNIVVSLMGDVQEHGIDCLNDWAGVLFEEMSCSPSEEAAITWQKDISRAIELLSISNDERFHRSHFINTQMDDDQELMLIENSIVALFFVTAIVAGALLGNQFVRPSTEFRRVRELAKVHDWAKQLTRRGRRLADRTIWSIADAWDDKVFEGDAESLSSACKLIASETEYELIEPQLGDAYDGELMKRYGNSDGIWILNVKSLGLRLGTHTVQPSIVQSTTSDRVALRSTCSLRLSQRCLQIMDAVDSPGSLNLNSDIVESVRNASKTDREFWEWEEQVSRNSPEGDLRVYRPSLGDRLDENSMLLRNEVFSPSNAHVTKLICPGLMRNDEVLIQAIVEAKDE